MTELLCYIYFIASFIYILFIVYCWYGWRHIPQQVSIHYTPTTSVSVIIPARNEEENILSCLEDLAEQNYPASLYEVIVIDDHSTDNTAGIIKEFIEVTAEKTFRLIQPPVNNTHLYKKAAITKGIEDARGQLIITTDADCRLPQKWISSIVQQYEVSKACFISGPVSFSHEQSLFSKMQSLEFMGLVGIGAGALHNGSYIMCNGANLAYSKKAFHDVNGFQAMNNTSSGDDTQMMLKIAETNPKSIRFLKSRDAIVSTSARNSIKDLVQQRKRWASKIPQHSSFLTLIVAISTYILNVSILIFMIAALSGKQVTLLLAGPFLFKCLVEFLFLLDVSGFFRQRNALWSFIPAQIFYPLYIIFIGAIAPFGTYQWKGRSVK